MVVLFSWILCIEFVKASIILSFWSLTTCAAKKTITRIASATRVKGAASTPSTRAPFTYRSYPRMMVATRAFTTTWTWWAIFADRVTCWNIGLMLSIITAISRRVRIDLLLPTHFFTSAIFFLIHMSHEGSTKYKEGKGDSNLWPIVHSTSILTTRPRHPWFHFCHLNCYY